MHMKSKLLTLSIVTILLSGCIGGSSPAVKYYLLDPQSAPAIVDTKDSVSLEVSRIKLPQYLDRPQIVSRTGDHQLKLSELNQWGGNLRKNLLRTLAVNLSQRLNTSHVAVAPHRSAFEASYRVSVDIIRFERDADNHVHLSAQWSINKGIERKVIVTRISNLKSEQAVADKDYNAIISAMRSQFARLSDDIALAIKEVHQ